MDIDMDFFWPFIVPVVAIAGWFTYSIVRSIANARVRELEVRERIAMIERGLVPPPEKDPQGFERAMNRYDRYRERDDDWDPPRYRGSARYRSAGVTLMGVGFGLMLMIGFAGGSIESGIGVGGFLVIIGMAFFVNSLLSRFDPPSRRPPYGRSSNGEPPRMS